MNAIVSAPGEGRPLEALGIRITVRVPRASTGGACSIVEMEAPPGFRAPPVLHAHEAVDWQGHVLAGAVAIEADGETKIVPQGGIVFVPRRTAFRWWNASEREPVRWMLTYMPGGFEEYFLDMGAALGALGRPPTPADIASLAPPLWAKHGVAIVRP